MTGLQPDAGVWDALNWTIALPAAGDSGADLPADADPLEREFETLRQELVLQARQLASYLENWQQDLDRRAAALHAQVAQFETDRRAARVWLEERIRHVEHREQRLTECES